MSFHALKALNDRGGVFSEKLLRSLATLGFHASNKDKKAIHGGSLPLAQSDQDLARSFEPTRRWTSSARHASTTRTWEAGPPRPNR